MSTGLFTHPDCEHHAMPRHPERPARLRAVMQRLAESGLEDELRVTQATEVSDATISLIHPHTHIELIATSEPRAGTAQIDADTYMSQGSLRAGRLAAGACVEATEAVLSGALDQAFCAVRPPGHHAEVARSMGFCLFNNLAIAAEVALQDARIERVAILDFDVHHCNGTVDIFKDRPEVLVCSSFQENFFPYRYLDFEKAHIINTPLAAGTDGTLFRQQVTQDWLPALERHQPDFIFISAGFDAHKDDPLGQLCFDDTDFDWATQQIRHMAQQLAGGRLVSALEGGYDLEALAGSVETHVAALLGN